MAHFSDFMTPPPSPFVVFTKGVSKMLEFIRRLWMAPYLGNFYGVKARLVWVSATKKRKKKICVEENELTFFCIMIRLQSLGFLFG